MSIDLGPKRGKSQIAMDDVRVYGRELSEVKVTELHAYVRTNGTAGVVAPWGKNPIRD
jgi:hypothetical protein